MKQVNLRSIGLAFILSPAVNALLKGASALIIPALLLLFAQTIDIISGFIAAPKRNQKRKSNTFMSGIRKKVAMWLLVSVGILADIFIYNAAQDYGFVMPKLFIVTVFVISWIFLGELLSIVENLTDLYNIPFLGTLLGKLKDNVDTKAEETLSNVVNDMEDSGNEKDDH